MNKDNERYRIFGKEDEKKLQELYRAEKENKAANLAQVNNSKKREKNRGKTVLVRYDENGKIVSNILDPKTNTWSKNQTNAQRNEEYKKRMAKYDAELNRGVNKGGKRTRRKRKRRRKSTKKKRRRKKTKKKRRKRRKRTKKSRY